MKFFSMCVTHREKACSINSCVPSGYNFLSFFFAVSPSKGNSSVHMLQLFVFTTIEDIESEKETAVVFHHEGNPPSPRQPFAVVCFDMQGFNPRSERSGPTTRPQSIPRLKSLKLLHLEYAENSTSGRGRARFYVTRKRNIAQV